MQKNKKISKFRKYDDWVEKNIEELDNTGNFHTTIETLTGSLLLFDTLKFPKKYKPGIERVKKDSKKLMTSMVKLWENIYGS